MFESGQPSGAAPDLPAGSPAIAHGSPLAPVAGNARYRAGAAGIFVTGSFWVSAVALAAARATLDAVADRDAVARMERSGQRLRDGLAAQAATHGVGINQT